MSVVYSLCYKFLGLHFQDNKNDYQTVCCCITMRYFVGLLSVLSVYVSDRDVVVLLGASLKEVDRKPATDLCQLFASVLWWQGTDAGRGKEGQLGFI